MRSELSGIEWAEPEELDISSPAFRSALGMRRACRVPVKLRVVIATRDCAFLADTVDISENGVLIENYAGPALRKGQRVLAIIKGILSDSDSDELLSPLYVTRVADERIALSFNKGH